MTGPLITAEAFRELQRRAERRGINLTRSEADGCTRVFVDGVEIRDFDDLDGVVNALASPWDIPVTVPKATSPRPPELSAHTLEEHAREVEQRVGAGAAALQSTVGSWRGVDVDALMRGECCACGAAKPLRQAKACEACAGDAALCEKLATTLAGTPQGLTEAAIARAAKR